MYTQSPRIAIARSLKLAILTLLISSVTSVHSLNLEKLQLSPTCNLVTRASTSPAYNTASWCVCTAPNGGQYPGAYPTTTPSGISSPSGNQLCAYTTKPTNTITVAPVTCAQQSASSGFTVPRTWCDCTAAGSSATYATMYGSFTGVNDPCAYTQDVFPAGTISPSPATCVPATAYPGSPFFNALAWCACGENALYPLPPQTTSQYKDPNSVQFCSYTAQPSSTITASALPFTSCQVTTKWPLATSVCECSGEGTSILYPTGTQNCVFSSVPTATVSLPTLAGQNCQGTCLYGGPCYACEYAGSDIVSQSSETEIKGGKANASLSSRLSALSSRRQTRLLNSVCWNTVLLGIHVQCRFSHYHHRAVFPCDRRKLLSYIVGNFRC